ncbi:MAG: GMC oxidoreductase, partial [Chloroflexota bacterium]|nr:GMC oxidoreductase [Chloroflexota bacterium]
TDLDFGGDFHGKSGPILVHRHPLDSLTDDQLAFHQACKYLGFPENPDHNLPDATGVGPYPLNNPGGVRFSTAVGYLGQSRHRLNLTIKANCTTKRIVFRRNIAVGVEVESGGEVFLAEGKEVVLCAGAIASPHLLMISGIGHSNQLEKNGIPVTYNAPAVGKNLRDHPTVHTMWKPSLSFNIPNQSVGPQKVALRYRAEGSPYENDMIMVMRYNHDIGNVGALVISIGIYLAESIGEMRLQSSNISVQPYLNYDMLSTESDLRRMREGVRLADKLATSPQFSSYTDGRVEPDQKTLDNDKVLDQWMLKNVTTMHHISGTCKMGPSNDAGAVVDQFGKVYGVTGLRVADVSIVPDCPRANTNIAAMTIGERVADFIKQGR